MNLLLILQAENINIIISQLSVFSVDIESDFLDPKEIIISPESR